MTTIDLPFPPSVNNLFGGGRKRRYVTRRYKAWRDEAGKLLMCQRPPSIPGPVAISIDLVAPDRRPRDADNYVKAVLDLLVRHWVIPGDDSRHVAGVSARWAERGPACRITIVGA